MGTTADARRRIEWARQHMTLLGEIADRFEAAAPFGDMTIGVSLHLEPKTAVLIAALQRGGASVVATGNLGTTQEDVAAVLRAEGTEVIGSYETDLDRHLVNVKAVAAHNPNLLLDNGGDLAFLAVENGAVVQGGTEETTSGAFRLREDLAGRVDFPVIVINDSPLKAIVENKHAVGQSVLESFLRMTNLMPQGKRFVVVGYGWCGRGIAHYARSLGAGVTIVEIDEIKALEAAMDGFPVDDLPGAAADASVLITATGRTGVVGQEVLDVLPDRSILANAGHFDTEIDIDALNYRSSDVAPLDAGIDAYQMGDGRTVYLLNGGRMFNLGGRAPKGNSIESMDLGFSLQALSLERLASASATLETGPQPVPDDINRTLAAAMVRAINRS